MTCRYKILLVYSQPHSILNKSCKINHLIKICNMVYGSFETQCSTEWAKVGKLMLQQFDQKACDTNFHVCVD